MRVGALALAAVAGVGAGCARRSLQSDLADDGGTGSVAVDARVGGGDSGSGVVDAAPPRGERPGLSIDCATSTITGGWLPLDFLVVLDRSPSGDRAAWTRLLDTLTDQILRVGGTDWGLYGFPKPGPACGAATVPPSVDLPVVPDNQQAVAAAVGAMISGGEGMPAAAAIDVGAAHLRALAAEEPKFLLLVTDRSPTCAGTGDQLSSSEPARAEADAVAAIGRAAAAMIGTIVLAPSTTAASDAAALDALAEVGGYPRALGAHKFFDETNFADLFIPAWARTCMLPLEYAPEARAVTQVRFNGVTVPHDPEHMNGWDYFVGPSSTNLQLYGSWCDRLTTERSFEVTIQYACLL